MVISWKKKNEKKNETFSNRTGSSVGDGKARGINATSIPVPKLPFCFWSSQLFDLRAQSSTGVPVLLLSANQLISLIGQTRVVSGCVYNLQESVDVFVSGACLSYLWSKKSQSLKVLTTLTNSKNVA